MGKLEVDPDVLVVERPDGSSWLLRLHSRTLRLETGSTQLLQAIEDAGSERAIRDLVTRFGTPDRIRGGLLIRAALTLAGRRAPVLHFVARWAMALFGWAATVRAWEQHYPQPGPDARVHSDCMDASVDVRTPERALVLLALARSGGLEADLVIGLCYGPLTAHVWVECGARVIGGLPQHCQEVLRYRGQRQA